MLVWDNLGYGWLSTSEDWVCLLDMVTLTRVERRGILVQPLRSTVSALCTDLTTLTQADEEAVVRLAQACQVLAQEHHASSRLRTSYGDYDRQQFMRNCDEFGLLYLFGPERLTVTPVLQ